MVNQYGILERTTYRSPHAALTAGGMTQEGLVPMYLDSTPSPIDHAIRIEGDTAYLQLRGKYDHLYAIIDAVDVDRLSQFKWHAKINSSGTWARRVYRDGTKLVTVYLHTDIVGDPPDGMVIDHISGDGLDNRRDNLRFANRSQNARNAKIRRGTKSGYKGVYPSGKKWVSRICVDYIKTHLGTYSTPEEAAHAYDRAAAEHYGDFAFLNFPEEASR